MPGNGTSSTALDAAIRDYVRTYVLWHGQAKAVEKFGVSLYTLWRFLERGRLGKSLPRAVIEAVGDAPDVIDAATWAMTAVRQIRRRAAARKQPLAETLEDTLRLLCSAPLATVEELSAFGRIPATTLRRRLTKLVARGLVDSIAHHLSALGPNLRRRHFPTVKGIEAAANVEHGTERFLSEYPVSREWFRLLTDRLDAVAVLYHVAAMIANADPERQPVRVDHHRQGPYDLLITLSGCRSLGIVRQGPVLSSANLRYRLRTLEQLRPRQRPTATLVLTHADQSTRRAFRTLGNPMEHGSTFVATEGELLAGDAQAQVWQQCGSDKRPFLPEAINPDVSLDDIMGWLGRRARHAAGDRPRPDPEELYPNRLRALVPQPTAQVQSALAVRLTRAEKQALDLLAAWSLCSTEQLSGLMGGVTRRRANQVIRSLTQHGLIRAEGESHLLTDEGLTWLARRDRASVGQVLDRWTAEPGLNNPRVYVGTALRSVASQPDHHAALITLAAALTAEGAKSQEYGVLDLLPTSRSAVGYWYNDTSYVVHPDISFILDLPEGYRHCFMEYERRATTPRRVRARLENYRRYFQSGYARRDHGGELPLVLFVFETPNDEDAFMDAASYVDHAPFASSNMETIAQHGILADTWLPPAPEPRERLPLTRLVRVPLFR
jgi:DNA-binding Lrp family transcriptional regulator